MPQPIADQIRSLPMSPNLGNSLERALGFAREQSHRAVTLEHLLLAFTEDPDASVVLQASNMDLLRLGTDVSGYLGRLPEDMRSAGEGEPGADPELVRVLQAAVQAAQQSRRRQIDGAIVLAAIVGDGKSPAAGLLKTHGLTFEDAIRALQKTTAKGPAQAGTSQPATSPSGVGTAPPSPDRAERTAPPAQAPEHQAPRTEAAPRPPVNDAGPAAVQASAAPPPANGRAPAEGGQSVEEILAAARARIEQRSAAMTGHTVTRTEAPPAPARPRERTSPPSPPAAERVRPPAAEAPPPSAAPSPTPPPPEPSAPPRSPTHQAPAARPSWTPPAGGPIPSRAQPEKAAPATPQRQAAPPPFPQASVPPGEGPPRPPLPGRVNASLPPQRPSSEPQAPQRPAANGARPNGAAAESHPMPPVPPGRPAQRAAGQPAQGPLVETIPRRMRAGETSVAQVRISRDRVDGLIQLLMRGRGGVQRPEALLSRALTVRLRAPDGGFWIEALSPETQWAETAAGSTQDEHLTWRWNVTPQERGRGRLLLLVSIRTTGRDGIVAETSPPERAIDITTGGGRFSGLGRWMGFLLVLLVGGFLGRFGEEVWSIASAIIKRIAG